MGKVVAIIEPGFAQNRRPDGQKEKNKEYQISYVIHYMHSIKRYT